MDPGGVARSEGVPDRGADVSWPEPFCGHGRHQLSRQGSTARCRQCGSFWDLRALAGPFRYDETYPARRGEFDPRVGDGKVRTLRRWLEAVGLDLRGRSVCEIGFGAGWCLAELRRLGCEVFGVEAVRENLRHAEQLGVPAERLFLVPDLPVRLPESIDVWLYQDSFEHLPDPAEHLAWVCANASARTVLLLVAPRAASPSDRLLGRWWPHRIADHRFHWSRAGLEGFLAGYGFQVRQRFHPAKLISLATIVSHLGHHQGHGTWYAGLAGLRGWFNIGEQGLLVERAPACG